MEVLSEDEVKALKLNESNTPVLSSSISVDELEKIIIQQKQIKFLGKNSIKTFSKLKL